MVGEAKPILHIIAGPNGAGKTTFYQNELRDRYPNVAFVNADELAQQHYGHAACTPEESRTGQRLADDLRSTLLVRRESLITESTFSHSSKIALVREALATGYSVVLYHVNVIDADLSVDRVAYRVNRGGHPVPEDKIRGRYDRNQDLIVGAVRLADRAYVFDNSTVVRPHRLCLELRQGAIVYAREEIPPWVQRLYGRELAEHGRQ